MKPTPFEGTCRSIGIVVIPFHDAITACYNFSECRRIMWNLVAMFIDYQKFTGSDQLHTLTSLDSRSFLGRERCMLWSWFADSDERRCLSQTIHLRDLPP